MKIKEYREKEKELNKKTKKELIKWIIKTEEWLIRNWKPY